jgi:hypothetical protein
MVTSPYNAGRKRINQSINQLHYFVHTVQTKHLSISFGEKVSLFSSVCVGINNIIFQNSLIDISDEFHSMSFFKGRSHSEHTFFIENKCYFSKILCYQSLVL